MDGQTLTDALHSHGINIRYLGKVMDCFMIWNFMPICHSYVVNYSHFVTQVAEMTKHLPHLRDICTNEIIVRSAKHILKVIFSNHCLEFMTLFFVVSSCKAILVFEDHVM